MPPGREDAQARGQKQKKAAPESAAYLGHGSVAGAEAHGEESPEGRERRQGGGIDGNAKDDGPAHANGQQDPLAGGGGMGGHHPVKPVLRFPPQAGASLLCRALHGQFPLVRF